jgi:hypothetical protein
LLFSLLFTVSDYLLRFFLSRVRFAVWSFFCRFGHFDDFGFHLLITTIWKGNWGPGRIGFCSSSSRCVQKDLARLNTKPSHPLLIWSYLNPNLRGKRKFSSLFRSVENFFHGHVRINSYHNAFDENLQTLPAQELFPVGAIPKGHWPWFQQSITSLFKWTRVTNLKDQPPRSQKRAKPANVTRRTVTHDDYEKFVQRKEFTSTYNSFKEIEPRHGPNHTIPTPGNPPIIPTTCLLHQKYDQLYTGLVSDGTLIVDFQFCDICRKWLKTGIAFQNRERHYADNIACTKHHALWSP